MYENMIVIDREAPESLQKQIRRQIAIGIVNRQYPLHQPLPSIRQLSSELGVSVTTVALAYEGLKQDGFVEGRDRSGYYVNRDVLTDPGHAIKARGPAEIAQRPPKLDYRAFFRGRSFDRERVVKPPDSLVRYRYPFVCGLIDPSLFPIASWRECVRDSVNVVEVGNWATDYSATDDHMLIEQLIQRVLAKRGIVAHPDEVLVTVGGQQALYLAVRLLLSPGATLGVEDPGYPDVINIAEIEGINVRRLPVDRKGLVVSEEVTGCKCLFVTPSHQFPTTVTMPLERKLRLLEITKNNGQFVIEDDYESDISFNMTPPRALKSLDTWGNVIYTGSLSKSLLPGCGGVSGGGSRIRPGGKGPSPLHAEAPSGEQPEECGAVSAKRVLRPVRCKDHEHLPAAVLADASGAGVPFPRCLRGTGVRRGEYLAPIAGRDRRRHSPRSGSGRGCLLRNRWFHLLR